MPKVFLVLGSSSGFGLETVKKILAEGDIAVATLRNVKVLDNLRAQYPSSQLLVLPVDVTKPDQVTDAFVKIKETFGRLDVVVNNAGITDFGEVEGTPDERARDIFNTNFFGAADVMKKAVAFFRDENPSPGGHLINVSSVLSIVTFPLAGYYNASKHALDGLTNTLAAELDPAWNIKVTILNPGAFRTSIIANSASTNRKIHPAYTSPTLPSTTARAWAEKEAAAPASPGDPVKFAKLVYEVASSSEPAARYFAGSDALALVRGYLKDLSLLVEEGAELTVATDY